MVWLAHKRFLKFLISVSFKRPALDESILEAIAADENVPLLEKRDIVRDLRFTFYSRTTETATAESDLSRAIEVIVTDQELARQMAQYEREVAARHSEEWMSDDDWERHQHIHSQRRAYSLRIQEYKANQEELLAA